MDKEKQNCVSKWDWYNLGVLAVIVAVYAAFCALVLAVGCATTPHATQTPHDWHSGPEWEERVEILDVALGGAVI